MTAPLLTRYRPLLIGAAALVVLPFAMSALGLTISTATVVVFLTIAVLGLNMMMGYTGLISFGHGAWFGIGAYAAAIAQRNWFGGQIFVPILFAVAFVALLSLVVGALMLRRRGVYFALMTLALSALVYTISFRWTEVTGGEDGLGGLTRGTLGPIDLGNAVAWYAFVAVIGLAVLYALIRVTRSPFGHTLVAIRENQKRASFQGYPVQRYKLAVFVLSSSITALAGALSAFQHYIVTAEATSVDMSGELLAMVVIGGMHNILGPAVGVLFYIVFRELFSIWTGDWLFWFGLVFVAFVMYSPGGIVGVWGLVKKRFNPPAEDGAAMSSADGIQETFNTRYASLAGYQEALRKLKPIPRAAARFDLTTTVRSNGAKTTTDAVDLLLTLLLRVPLAASARAALITTLTDELGTDQLAEAETYMEYGLRVVAHLIMSSPQYQLA